jgi:hypothetical protein
MEVFTFYLKNEKTKSYDRIALFILLINIIAFAYLAINTGPGFIRNKSIGGLIIIGVCLVIDYFLKNLKKNQDTGYRDFIHLGITIAWINMSFWIPAAVNLLLGTFYFFSKKKLMVTVDKNGILYPSFPVKKIKWEELSAMVIKDGLFTVDFKNNRLIQQAVDEGVSTVNEKVFNEFCSKQLT